ncbi:MAG: DUF3857 domain-containing protein [Bacteroidetes bacterium]|jgi:hypothetical protein|nr:DUF3857 domain-containing protein [Bacteroidota bacterium]MBT6687149.1 DUF3857 domain-containing protein [Bacteroidota bacterium]MBT7144922.1 DUF3857 domain-containing protein [Bacteroidota bacterium]MBT7492159.1 DUF3857 domain-containing protein [Bacteroidota bacterium]
MKYKHILLLVILASLISCNSSKKTDDTTDMFPNADAVYINMTKEYQLNEDGTILYNYSHRLKYLSYFSFNRKYGETFIAYNPEFQDLKINISQTTMADGKLVKAPGNAFNEVLPSYAANAPAFNHLREMVVTHTALEKNSIVDLDYTITNKSESLPALMGSENISSSSPVKNFQIIVKIPKDKLLKYELLNDTLNPKIEAIENYTLYKWEFKNVSADVHELLQSGKTHPKLLFSTANSEEVFSDFVSQEAFSYNIGESEKKWVRKNTGLYKDEFQYIKTIQKAVVNDLNFWNIPLDICGYKIRTTNETWESNGGTKLEKTLLLCALLSQANISAEPVVMIPNNCYNQNIGLLEFYDFFVKIKLRNEIVHYFSAINMNSQDEIFSNPNKTIIPLNINNREVVETSRNLVNEVIVDYNFELNSSLSVSGNAILSLNNENNPYVELQTDESKVKKLLSSLAVKSFEIVESTPHQLQVKYNFDGDKPFREHGSYYFWNLPSQTQGIRKLHIEQLAENRTTDLELEKLIVEKYTYSVELPENYKLVSPLKNFSEKNNVGELAMNFSIQDNLLKLERSIKLNKKNIHKTEYKHFRKLFSIWTNSKNWELIIKKTE